MNAREDTFAKVFGARCDDARAALRKHMGEHGLREEDGWTIYEFTRELDGRTELVMRPMHSTLSADSDIECVCTIDEPGVNISSECRS